ncbi:P-loop containing nucleoside triphosphate hydrolase protein [Nemania abortiva]|nr:P-loop containing nucleoside triphosphate hydrolase protein [Nemania abortiva]
MASQTSKPELPCYMIEDHLCSERILGRQNTLDFLDEHLLCKTPAPLTQKDEGESFQAPSRLVTVTGLPGVGKTAVAAAFASSRRGHYDAVFWVNSSSKDKIRDRFIEIAQKLRLRNYDEDFDPISAVEDAKDWLAKPIKILNPTGDIVTPQEAQWLLIFDNADDPGVLEGFLPPLGIGSILITTRRPQYYYKEDMQRLQMSSMQVHFEELEPLSINEGAELIRTRTNAGAGQQEECVEISQILGGIPLALLQCAQMLRKGKITSHDFLTRYQHADQRESLVKAMEEEDIAEGCPALPVRCNLTLSWMGHMSPEARAVADTFSFLDPDGISQAIQEKLFAIDFSNLLPGLPRQLSRYSSAIEELRLRAFVKSDDQTLRINRSVQYIFQLYMNRHRRNQALCCAVALLMEHFEPYLWSGRSHGTERWAECNPLLHHLTRIVELYHQCSAGHSWDPNLMLARLLYRCSWIQFEQMNIRPILPFLELAGTICETVSSEDSEKILRDVRHTLGAIGTWTNNAKMALYNTKQVLRSWQLEAQQTGVYDRNIAAGYCQYATALMMEGNYTEAEENLRKALGVLSKLEDKELASSHKLILGYNLWLQNRLDEAEDILRNGLAIREEKFGKLDTYSYKSGAYHAALGNTALSRGDFKEAQSLHEYALTQYEKTLGKHHPGTADMYHAIARYKQRDGRLDEAISLVDQALDIWNHDAEFHIPERARSTFTKSKALRKMGGQIKEAQALSRRAATLWESFTGEPHVEDRVLDDEDFDKIVMFWSR